MSLKTLITSRDPKGLHIIGLCEAALNKAKLDEDQAQRLIENGGKFQQSLRGLIDQLSASHQFADEEVGSGYEYPSGYSPRQIGDQIDILLARWPTLNPDGAWKYAKSGLVLPIGAEASFCLIRPDFFNNSYNVGVTEILEAIKTQRECRFYNWREGWLGPQYLRQHQRTVARFRTLADQQGGDILVVPAQFGLRHRGRSVRRAREVFLSNEVGLGAFAIGCMLLTHPERLVQREQLHVDCAGDEYALGADGQFSDSPCFDWCDGRLRFGGGWAGDADQGFGSASGFFG